MIMFNVTMFWLVMVTSTLMAGEVSLGPIGAAAPVKGQNQFNPDVAYGNGGYLAVWQRSRNENGRIECARLDVAGKALDAKPIILAPEAEWQEVPRVAYGGGQYLVVWQDLRSGKELDIFASRVSPDGKLLDKGGIAVSKTPQNSSRFPSVVFDGKAFIVVWAQLAAGNKGNFKLFAARVDLAGGASAPQPLDIKYLKPPFSPNLEDFLESELVVANNSLYVFSGSWGFAQVFRLEDFTPMTSVEGIRPKDKRGKLIREHRSGRRRPTAASDGKNVMVSYWSGEDMSETGNLVSRILPDFTVEEYPRYWCGGKKGLGLMSPALVFDGENYLLARLRWSGANEDGVFEGARGQYGVNSQLCARRITPDGKPLGDVDLDVAGTSPSQLNTLPRMASDGKGHVIMVWEQHPTSPDGNIVVGTRMISTK